MDVSTKKILKTLPGIPFIVNNLNRSARTKGIAYNAVGSFLIKGLSILIGLVYVPLLLNSMTAEKYGVWLTITSIVNWINIFDLGLGHGLRNRFAEAKAKNDLGRLKSLVSTAYFYMTLLVLTLSLVLTPLILSLNWKAILNVNIVSLNELRMSILIVFISFSMRMVLNLVTTILKADQRPALSDIFHPISSVISLLLILLLSQAHHMTLISASMIISIPPIIVLVIVQFLVFKRAYSYCKPSMAYIDRALVRSIFSLGAKFFVIQIASVVIFGTSNVIISNLVGADQVSVYNIANKLFSTPLMIFTIVVAPYWSAVTEAYSKGELSWMKKNMRFLNLLSIMLCFGIVILLTASKSIYKIWVGDSIIIPFSVSLAVAVQNMFYIVGTPFSNFVAGMGKLKLGVYIVSAKAVLFVPVAYYLTLQYQVVGLVMATVLVNSIPSIIIEPILYRKQVNGTASGIWNK